MDRTNAGVRPPEEHLLLRDSRTAALRNDGRKAVIDAASAVEVALARAIRTRLTTAPSEESIDRVLEDARGVMELYDLAAVLGIGLSPSRGEVAGRLAGRRNLAVHEGKDPGDVAVREAQETARAIVVDASPL